MNENDLKNIILDNLKDKNEEIKRVFHGRGNFYEDFSHLTVDSINDTLFASFYESNQKEKNIILILEDTAKNNNFSNFIVQRKYKSDDFYEVIFGGILDDFTAIENGLKYKINFKNRNIGLFFDMKKGREYIKSISKDKSVLNLFSYTCAFSVSAIAGGASTVINVDMSKPSLSMGRENHRINNLDTKKVKFLPYNILKSISTIRKDSPFDIVIIDPPSFQKNSFVASKDYEKIIKKLDLLTKKGSIVLACLNDPFLSSDFLIELFKINAKDFQFVEKLENSFEFITNNEENSLKSLVFLKKY
ncbi:class I SAM-dependent methyltransferase [Aliarcobacter vitoriensis]|uniref:SAM-dependent methyltransferase n=1 Tax=Aliarcobacter vitoriensis TaxID=2011099 RepID=A0A366MUQ2_9BACT|nr:class I SAM-dependent methyltransferase [Aliarcobacter vitoriensis]RBQ29209.1 SAM-dependent methyltransferase [Aliarcobacter vitoriensis]